MSWSMLTCGSNACGQLGHNSIDEDAWELREVCMASDNIYSKQQEQQQLLRDDKVCVSAGANHTVVLVERTVLDTSDKLKYDATSASDTLVLVCGDTSLGQLPGILPSSTPLPVLTESNVCTILSNILASFTLKGKEEVTSFVPLNVSCGWNHTAIAFKCGCAAVFGHGAYGQLGCGKDLVDGSIKNETSNIFTSLLLAPECHVKHYIHFDQNVNASQCLLHNEKDTQFSTDISCSCGYRVCHFSKESKISRVSSVTCGTYTTMFLDSENGVVAGCGWNKFGELGTHSTEDNSSSVFVKLPLKGSFICEPLCIDLEKDISSLKIKIKRISCGQNHSVLICDDGDNNEIIFTLGRNNCGQLGVDPSSNKQICNPIQVHIDMLDKGYKVVNVCCTWSNTYLLLEKMDSQHDVSNRVLIGVGRCDHGLLTTLSPSFTRIGNVPCRWQFTPIPISENISILDIATGSEHLILLVCEDNVADDQNSKSIAMYSMGWNEHGNCGVGPCNSIINEPQKGLPPPDVVIPKQMIVCETSHSMHKVARFHKVNINQQHNKNNESISNGFFIFAGAGHSGAIFQSWKLDNVIPEGYAL